MSLKAGENKQQKSREFYILRKGLPREEGSSDLKEKREARLRKKASKRTRKRNPRRVGKRRKGQATTDLLKNRNMKEGTLPASTGSQ